MNIISLGAGVQSSTMALMAALGEITPMPDAAIFSDTGWEPRKVVDFLDWLEHQLPFPVYRVMHKNGIKAALLDPSLDRFAAIPFFTSTGGMGMRQCSSEYKIKPVQRKTRELLGYEKGQRIPSESVTMWIGISMDESVRMKPSREKWIVNRWPLIEMRMTRGHCLEWMQQHGFPEPPKSSCLGCPYHSDKQWLEIKNGNPDEWADTVAMDNHIRDTKRMKFQQYMHKSLLPMDQVQFSEDSTIDMFGNECEGICGV